MKALLLHTFISGIRLVQWSNFNASAAAPNSPCHLSTRKLMITISNRPRLSHMRTLKADLVHAVANAAPQLQRG